MRLRSIARPLTSTDHLQVPKKSIKKIREISKNIFIDQKKNREIGFHGKNTKTINKTHLF